MQYVVAGFKSREQFEVDARLDPTAVKRTLAWAASGEVEVLEAWMATARAGDYYVDRCHGFIVFASGPGEALDDTCPTCGGELIRNDATTVMVDAGIRRAGRCIVCGDLFGDLYSPSRRQLISKGRKT